MFANSCVITPIPLLPPLVQKMKILDYQVFGKMTLPLAERHHFVLADGGPIFGICQMPNILRLNQCNLRSGFTNSTCSCNTVLILGKKIRVEKANGIVVDLYSYLFLIRGHIHPWKDVYCTICPKLLWCLGTVLEKKNSYIDGVTKIDFKGYPEALTCC